MSEMTSMIKGKKYTWGNLVKIHEIGEYQIVEYYGHKYENNCRVPGEYEEVASFHAYINEKDTNQSYESLDAALAGAIAYKHNGPNSQAARFFMKMIA